MAGVIPGWGLVSPRCPFQKTEKIVAESLLATPRKEKKKVAKVEPKKEHVTHDSPCNTKCAWLIKPLVTLEISAQ